MNKRHNILIVDELDLRELVTSYLRKEGFAVYTAETGDEAIKRLEQEPMDLVVLDVMMDEMDGFTACKEIRAFSQIPIIMLTARGGEDDKVMGLQIGADDYIVKPFSPRELVARIEVALRRTQGIQQVDDSGYRFNELRIQPSGRKVFVNGQEISLTKKEYDLLVFLLEHRGRVFTREHLHDRLWGMDTQQGTLRTVDTHIKTLRLKLKPADRFIKTVWGVGYKFEVDS